MYQQLVVVCFLLSLLFGSQCGGYILNSTPIAVRRHDVFGKSATLCSPTKPQTTTTCLRAIEQSALFTDRRAKDSDDNNDRSFLVNTRTNSHASSYPATTTPSTIRPWVATLSKILMQMYIASMCVALPLTLLPQQLFYKFGLISKLRQEQWALSTGQFCARWLLRLFPFCNVHCIGMKEAGGDDPQPSIWVCNHSSQLDIFLLLAKDLKLRGKNKRPIKIVYWKQLEDNPIIKLMFQQCGFIPVQMSANKAGEDNDYDVASFKNLLKMSKQAFQDGFDIGILPEGQLNPSPENGLLPIFPGAFTLARMSKRPIQMMAIHGAYQLWHPKEEIGMTVTGRNVQMRIYPPRKERYGSGEEFVRTFNAVVGQFGTNGRDLPQDELHQWLDGSKWKDIQEERLEQQRLLEELQQQQKQQEDEDGDQQPGQKADGSGSDS